MRLSIVIPAYNEAKLIALCLDSVLVEKKNSGFDIEIIVVNNASTDNTREVILKYPEVKLVDEFRKGITWARQAGYDASTGDLIASVDADNILPHGWVKMIFDEFSKDKDLVALSGPLYYYDMTGWQNVQVKLFYILGYITYIINHYLFKKAGMLQGGNFVIRRSGLQKIGGYNTNIVFYGEDTDLARRLVEHGKIKFTFKFKILSSGRRLLKEGIVSAGCKYAVNYFWILFFKKPYHHEAKSLED